MIYLLIFFTEKVGRTVSNIPNGSCRGQKVGKDCRRPGKQNTPSGKGFLPKLQIYVNKGINWPHLLPQMSPFIFFGQS